MRERMKRTEFKFVVAPYVYLDQTFGTARWQGQGSTFYLRYTQMSSSPLVGALAGTGRISLSLLWCY